MAFWTWLWLFFASAWAGPSMSAAKDDPTAMALEEPPLAPAHWVEVHDVYTTVHAAPEHHKVALVLSRYAVERVPQLAAELGVAAGSRIHIYVAPDEALFRSLQPGRPPEWADGTAWPHRGLIFLKAPEIRDGTASSLEQVLDHELVHVLLGRAFEPRPVPRWLQEGLAQVVAREYTPDLTRALATGMLGDNLLGLDEITGGFPADPVRAHLAYAQSADLVAYIQTTHGRRALPTLIAELSRGETFARALVEATGQRPSELGRAWKERLDERPLWVGVLTDETAFFALATLFLLGGGLRVRMRNRERLQRWEREEALQDALEALFRPRTPVSA